MQIQEREKEKGKKTSQNFNMSKGFPVAPQVKLPGLIYQITVSIHF